MWPVTCLSSRRFARCLAVVAAVVCVPLSLAWTVSPTGAIHAGTSPRDLYATGLSLQTQGKCSHAIPLFSQAIQLNHVYVNALIGRAQCAQALGSDDVAMADYTTALQQDPHNYGVLLQRAGAEIDNGSTGRAQSDAVAAFNFAPPQVPAYLSVARTLYSVADLSDAVTVMSHAVQLLPRNAALYIQRGQYEIGMDDYARAGDDYTHAIGLSLPGDKPDLYAALAQVQDQAQNYPVARTSIAAAIAGRPQDPALYVAAAGIERDAGNQAAAARRYGEALSHGASGSQKARVEESRGDVFVLLGKNSQAVRSYRAALALTHNSAHKAVLRAKIKAIRGH